jgi:hypothetical protein
MPVVVKDLSPRAYKVSVTVHHGVLDEESAV